MLWSTLMILSDEEDGYIPTEANHGERRGSLIKKSPTFPEKHVRRTVYAGHDRRLIKVTSAAVELENA